MSGIENAIAEAIKSKRELNLKVKYGLGNEVKDLKFQPYIYGDDFLQYPFVWGYFSYPMVFYKLLIEHIIEARITDTAYTVQKAAVYSYSIEEEHYTVLEGFDKIYADAAIPTQGKKDNPIWLQEWILPINR